MSVRDKPHYEISSAELAVWLERQGRDRWWNVDGDPLLTGLLSLPCPVDELAAGLRRVGRPLLVLDKSNSANASGQKITARELDQLASRLGDDLRVDKSGKAWASDRFFVLSWRDSNDDWLLLEDEESSALARGDSQHQAGKP